MNFKKIALTLGCAGFAVAAMAQGTQGRAFVYDGSNATNGLVTFQINGDGPNNVFSGYIAGTTYGQNGIPVANYSNAAFLAQTLINVSSYVYISGNFGAVYNVSGIGAATDLNTYNQDIEVRTNRNLTFSTTGFYAPNNASIAYTLQLFQDFPATGVPIGPAVSGTDSAFNHQSVVLNVVNSLPADGKATLRLSRNLTVTQGALGGQSYTAAGFIQVGVN